MKALTKRRRLLLFALLAAGGAAVLLSPPVYWRVVGTVRGEALLQGRPTSYWRGELASAWCTRSSLVSDSPPVVQVELMHQRWELVAWAGRWIQHFTGWSPRVGTDFVPLVPSDDPAALPVLVVLLDDPDAKVRAGAAGALGSMGAAARPAVPALRRLTGDTAVVQLTPGGSPVLWCGTASDPMTVGRVATSALALIEPPAVGQPDQP
jgi:HEAT repeats